MDAGRKDDSGVGAAALPRSAKGSGKQVGKISIVRPKKAELTNKEMRFVDEYLIDLNATQAAIRSGYSKRSAGKIAFQLLDKTRIANAIELAIAERRMRTKVDADWVLNRLVAELEADIADLYDESDCLKPVRQWPAVWRKGLVSSIDTEELHAKLDGKRVQVGVTRKMRFADRMRRLELLGKHASIDAFSEKPADNGVKDLFQEALKNCKVFTPNENK
jgi:phage terminase small subunit